MDDKLCWNCGHSFNYHLKIEGGCSYGDDGQRCDCTGYEDAEYAGHQRKRDLYTVSDRRRLTKANNTRR